MKPIVNKIVLRSTELIHSPGILAWAINGYHFNADRKNLQQMLMDGFGFTREFADKLLSKQIPFTVEGDSVVIETTETIFQPGKRPARKVERPELVGEPEAVAIRDIFMGYVGLEAESPHELTRDMLPNVMGTAWGILDGGKFDRFRAWLAELVDPEVREAVENWMPGRVAKGG